MIPPHTPNATRFETPRGSKERMLDFDRPVSYCLRGLEDHEGEGA